MQIKIKRLTETAKIPTHGSNYAAGRDLYSDQTIEIFPHDTEKIKTNISLEIPKGYYGAIFARSGLATKNGLRPANCVGVIDSDYRGNIIVALHNDSPNIQKVEKGDRIAQLVIQPYLPVSFDEVDELTDTERNVGGFGSTGI